jgi:hypothetical protein
VPIAPLALLMPVYCALVVVVTKSPPAFHPIVPVPKASTTIHLHSSNASPVLLKAVPPALIHKVAPHVSVLLLRAVDLFVLAVMVKTFNLKFLTNFNKF